MPVGFWRRNFSFLLDTLFLGGLGYLLSLYAREQLIALGSYGRFVGVIIATAYFTILNSSIANGQTLGKRILGIRVVDQHGQPISVARALVRSLILCSAYFLNGIEIALPPGRIDSIIISISLIIIVFGFGSAILFFSIFDKPYRRGLHDLITNTVVVQSESPVPSIEKLSSNLVWIYSFILLAIIGASVYLNARLEEFGSYARATEIMKITNDYPGVLSVPKVFITPPYSIVIRVANPPAQFQKSLPNLCKKIQLAFPNEPTNKDINFIMIYGFDIGIASHTETSRAQCNEK
ncbi:RDD family protein [Leptospira koniambonensis]|uniref:RDD family protein n=1 Tax=Leptospira koniambonensis TaxID=2484950 RepID=UPI003EC1359B